MTYSQYTYSLILCTVSNKHLFNTNNEINKYITRYNNNLHLPIADLSKFNKRTYKASVKVFQPQSSIYKNFGQWSDMF
jgi:hypothetical protein